MLEKKVTYDHSITEDGSIQVRQITRIMDNDVEIAKTYHRHVVEPGNSAVGQDERTVKLVAAVHTLDIITDFNIEREKERLKCEVKTDA